MADFETASHEGISQTHKYKITARPVRYDGDVAYVSLTKGYEAKIDACDAASIGRWNWAVVGAPEKPYAVRYMRFGDKVKAFRMHRELLGDISIGLVDHINGDGLDNRRENLREATPSQNCCNQGPRSNNKSGFKGVWWCKTNKKWASGIAANGRRKALGLFDTAEAAYEAYCAASARMHGEFSRVR